MIRELFILNVNQRDDLIDITVFILQFLPLDRDRLEVITMLISEILESCVKLFELWVVHDRFSW